YARAIGTSSRSPYGRPPRLDPDLAGWTDSAAAGDAGDLGHRGHTGLDLLEAVLAQTAHPLLDRNRCDLLRGRPLERQRANLIGAHHHLVDPRPPSVAHRVAAHTPHGLVRLDVELRVEPVVAQHLGGHDRPPLAVRAQRAGQAL